MSISRWGNIAMKNLWISPGVDQNFSKFKMAVSGKVPSSNSSFFGTVDKLYF
jgi:hypothetical protein